MKTHPSLTQEKIAEIIAAREYWREWAEGERRRAENGFALHASADTGFAVVRAYDLELETGKPHCSRCLKPVTEQHENRGCR